MSTTRTLLSATAILAVVTMANIAHAEFDLPVPRSGWIFVGIIDGVSTVAVSQDGGATCVHIDAFDGAKLSADWVIRAPATVQPNFIYAVDTTFEFCGKTIRPIVTNGFLLTLVGGTGADIINGGFNASSVLGGFGNDTLTGRRSAVNVRGHDGNDVVSSTSTLATLEGGNGDDIGCANNVTRTVRNMLGGSHLVGDRRCGTGTAQHSQWESTSCAAPCE